MNHPCAQHDASSRLANEIQILILEAWLSWKLGDAITTYQEEDFLEEEMG